MSDSKPYKVLFLCTGNSARSTLGEYLLRQIGGPRFDVYSAGSFPTGKVNPYAVSVLRDIYNLNADDATSKSWETFGDTQFDFVITVCDNARETCPIWPGQPVVAHWGLPDPVETSGSADEIYRTFKQTAFQLQRRIELFVALPLEKLDRLELVKLTNEIGENQTHAEAAGANQ